MPRHQQPGAGETQALKSKNHETRPARARISERTAAWRANNRYQAWRRASRARQRHREPHASASAGVCRLASSLHRLLTIRGASRQRRNGMSEIALDAARHGCSVVRSFAFSWAFIDISKRALSGGRAALALSAAQHAAGGSAVTPGISTPRTPLSLVRCGTLAVLLGRHHHSRAGGAPR